ncbi:ATP-binding protein [Streptomyces sp. NPDC001941]|uniref:ATP-binding protein n=1 Tax=Streptomyces sp. NPDC001941 TaxID=3154659 RepID=UPI0033347E2A
MKQSAAKALGVAALGAAFAAAAAGSASAVAAAPAVPDAGAALDTVTHLVPVENTAAQLPAGGPEALSAGKNALASGVAAAPATANQTLPAVTGKSDADPVSGLLGGLPTGGLPTGGLPTSTLPTGAVPSLG